MSIDVIENVVMLMAAVVGLVASLFRYIETPKRGWLYTTAFFLAHILSDYYWTVYIILMHEDPDVSAVMAYFGWNIGYIFLLVAALHMRAPGAKRYFHPLMLLPIPLNIAQFILYLPYGGVIENVLSGVILTLAACVSLQSILYYIKTRRSGTHFPFCHLIFFLFVLTEYGMWTSSCFSWPSNAADPYYYFAFSNYIVLTFFAWAVGKDYEAEGYANPEKTAEETKFQVLLQIVVLLIIFGCCFGGYCLVDWMKGTLSTEILGDEAWDIIAVTLFIVSVILVVLIVAILFLVATRYRNMEQEKSELGDKRRNRYSFLFIIMITLSLMIFSVTYTSRVLYSVSAEGIYGVGEDTASLVASEMENYLSAAVSALEVTADTVNLMLQRGESQEKIYLFLTDQTVNQKKHFDENFTGIYAFSRGEYMDGSGWIPPDDYDAQSRDWYKDAVKANGKIIIEPPYVDAQTHSMVITICRLIEDAEDQQSYSGRNVVALDMIVDHIKDITQGIDVSGKGYGMVVDRDGMIVAHHVPELSGESFIDIYGQELFDEIAKADVGTLDTEVNGEDCTIFLSDVLDNWYVVLVVSDAELLAEARSQLVVQIAVSVIIFVLITLFYFLGYKSEQAYGRKMEEMRAGRQKQEYEARMLKLEKKASDEANKAKSSFLADMSHEIRTPINAILGMNEMILREATGSNIREYAKNISVSGKNLLQLINSILDFSKIEDGKMEIVPVRYKLSSMLSYLENSVAERARDKGLELNMNISPTLPSELYGDDARISQAVMNLLTNAVKYTPEGSVTLSVIDKRRSYENVLMYVEVKDTGIGIRESDMEKLFESFERLDVVKNRNIEGTGLGMSITTKLLNLMDSELKVESTYGEGSIFYFELWQRIENSEPIGDYKMVSRNADDSIPEGEAFRAPEARILIADDTKMNLTVAVNLLKRTNIQIDTVMNGPDAIELAANTAYDVILLDQRMPGMDGTQTLKKIRELENCVNKDTPVICLTADAIRGARDRYLSEGFTDYLTKPVDGRSLEKMLLTYLPEEKIEREDVKEESEAEEADIPAGMYYDVLHKAGIETDKGLEVCGDDDELYREILTEYAADHTERRECLARYYEEKDWDNYVIYSHSLKSSSKTIGAMELSEIAAGLEAASGAKDEDTINRDHSKAIAMYDKAVEAINSYNG